MKTNHTCPTCGGHLLFPLEASVDIIEAHWPTWVQELRARKLSKEYTYHAEQRYRDYIEPHFKGILISDIRPNTIKKFYLQLLKQGRASKTIKHILDLLRTFLNWCVDEELINACPRFPRVKVEYREKQWIDQVTQQSIIEQIPVSRQAYFRVLVETGARISEVCALKARDMVDGSLRICRAFDSEGQVKERKTGGEYMRPLSYELYNELIASASNMLPDAWLFTHQGRTITRYGARNCWYRACRKVGIKISLQQGTRHSRATQLNNELEAQTTERLRKELGHTASGVAQKHYVLKRSNQV